ncbi:MAG TPA: DoxX family protein [Candidatus Dormibacteraeota bacterium]|nr:DoxX family protein [Candidatus Dormibacteraeota bacterium]
MAAAGLLILRVAIGGILFGHGAQKVFGWWGGPGLAGWTQAMTRMRIRPPRAWALISAFGELVGGILLALGLLTPFACAAIASSMLVAIALVHWPRGFWVSKGGYEFNISILGATAALALIGPGSTSLDAALRFHFPEPTTLIAVTVAMLGGASATLLSRGPAPVPAKTETA